VLPAVLAGCSESLPSFGGLGTLMGQTASGGGDAAMPATEVVDAAVQQPAAIGAGPVVAWVSPDDAAESAAVPAAATPVEPDVQPVAALAEPPAAIVVPDEVAAVASTAVEVAPVAAPSDLITAFKGKTVTLFQNEAGNNGERLPVAAFALPIKVRLPTTSSERVMVTTIYGPRWIARSEVVLGDSTAALAAAD
jgi:hypothetical protein